LKVEHAARVGARYAARQGPSFARSDVQNVTVEAAADLRDPPLTAANVAVSTPTPGPGEPASVVVVVTYDYTPRVPVVRSLLPQPVRVQGRVRMRLEG
ncbi:MAG: hypothetical protein QHJ73_10770, partial [Armatimonadota bacterium]|nr:hypothetical protein [Armatimonadota bacterium]